MNLAAPLQILPLIVQMPVFCIVATLRGSPFADVPTNNMKVVPQDQIAAIDPKPYKSPTLYSLPKNLISSNRYNPNGTKLN